MDEIINKIRANDNISLVDIALDDISVGGYTFLIPTELIPDKKHVKVLVHVKDGIRIGWFLKSLNKHKVKLIPGVQYKWCYGTVNRAVVGVKNEFSAKIAKGGKSGS